MTSLEQSIEEHFRTWPRQGFFGYDPKALATRTKPDKWEFILLKTSAQKRDQQLGDSPWIGREYLETVHLTWS
jgi:hypothetical protein